MTSALAAAETALAQVLALAVAFVALSPSPALAASVAPRKDAAVETVLLDAKRRPAGDMVGTWVHDAGGLGVKQAGPERNAAWLAKGPDLGDAFVRVRIDQSRPRHFAILVRAHAHTRKDGSVDASRISGYQLAIRGDGLSWMRRDDGVLRPLGASVAVKRLRRKKKLELGIWMIGAHLVAQVYDGETLLGMGSVSISDRRYPAGRVGVFAFLRRSSAVRVSYIGYSGAGGPAKAGGAAPQGAQAAPRPDAPAGNRRFGTASRARLRGLPRSLRRRFRILEPVDAADPSVSLPRPATAADLVRFRCDVAAFERLRRAGVVDQADPVDTPFRYLDHRFLKLRAAWKQGQTPSALGSYADPDMVADAMRYWARKHRRIAQLVELGKSRQGRPILALRLGLRRQRKPAVLLNGTHHGDELMSTLYVMDAIETLLNGYGNDEELTRLLRGVDLWAVPLVNPDGVATFFSRSTYTGRKNRRDLDGDGHVALMEGVDLNRNYPFRWGALGSKGSSSAGHSMYYRGDRPGSEPETQAIMRLVDTRRFAASISYHTWGTVILTPYTIDGVRNPKGDEARPVAKRMAEETPRQPNRRKFRVRRKIYAVDGTDQDWMRAAHGVVALLVEGPTHNPTWPARRVADVEAVRGTWMSLLRRVVDGPTLTVRVRDKAGKPVVAEVRVDDVAPAEGELWTTRCRDGRATRLLNSPGVHEVSVRVGGLPVVRRKVAVSEGAVSRLEVAVDTKGSTAPSSDCPDPKLCSVEARCEAELGRCARESQPRWCRIDGRCVLRGQVGPRPECACRPERDTFHFTTPTGNICGR